MMIVLLKKGASKEENLMWAKVQMAYKAGFRFNPEDHKDCGCNCGPKFPNKEKNQ